MHYFIVTKKCNALQKVTHYKLLLPTLIPNIYNTNKMTLSNSSTIDIVCGNRKWQVWKNGTPGLGKVWKKSGTFFLHVCTNPVRIIDNGTSAQSNLTNLKGYFLEQLGFKQRVTNIYIYIYIGSSSANYG